MEESQINRPDPIFKKNAPKDDIFPASVLRIRITHITKIVILNPGLVWNFLDGNFGGHHPPFLLYDASAARRRAVIWRPVFLAQRRYQVVSSPLRYFQRISGKYFIATRKIQNPIIGAVGVCHFGMIRVAASSPMPRGNTYVLERPYLIQPHSRADRRKFEQGRALARKRGGRNRKQQYGSTNPPSLRPKHGHGGLSGNFR